MGFLDFFKPQPRITYQYGEPKHVDDLTLEDFVTYPIWEMYLEDEENYAEFEWYRPVLNATDVTKSLDFSRILLKDKHSETWFCAQVCIKNNKLDDCDLWRWNEENDEFEGYDPDKNSPLTLVAIPTIKGVENCEFNLGTPK